MLIIEIFKKRAKVIVSNIQDKKFSSEFSSELPRN